MNGIILFDGICNFCNQSVQFIIKKDPKGYYKFASLQSDIGQKLLEKYKIPHDIDSIILIDNEEYYVKSSAALHICRNLEGIWKLFYLLVIIPRPIRDFFYEIIAKNRYKWFGKRESCMLPAPGIKERFLE
ncbi:thiol-disulfide oxidoreductase DCC family protein [Aneurinibacillus tyrosinisolvens]|uniref:thiol-disulfide oxidoreductase DCC family protein n=1 Tax=Aneurinibacillus tyrosinisolvens TaxID=1443435 RepID=UPI00063F60A9|nr:thiol-disulfide oxidoreductase DCC family protein [Aneurinibacillus tyrosinisolvens]